MGYYSGGPGSPFEPMRAAPPLSILPRDIRALIERALGSGGARNPAVRPTPGEWCESLDKMYRTL